MTRKTMRIYTLYIDDDRYSVPSLLSIEHEDDDGAMAHAVRLLASSSHYLAVEVWEDDRHLAKLFRPENAAP
jgi:hypothetical protein